MVKSKWKIPRNWTENIMNQSYLLYHSVLLKYVVAWANLMFLVCLLSTNISVYQFHFTACSPWEFVRRESIKLGSHRGDQPHRFKRRILGDQYQKVLIFVAQPFISSSPILWGWATNSMHSHQIRCGELDFVTKWVTKWVKCKSYEALFIADSRIKMWESLTWLPCSFFFFNL